MHNVGKETWENNQILYKKIIGLNNSYQKEISCFDALSAYVRALSGLATHVSSSNLWLLTI